MTHKQLLSAAFALAAAGTTLAQGSPGTKVVQFQAGDTQGHLAGAVVLAGVTPDLVLDGDFRGLTNALNDPEFGVALIDNPCCFFAGGTSNAMADFVARGNRVQMSFWNIDDDPLLMGVFGLTSAIDYFVPKAVYDNITHASWGDTPSPVLPNPISDGDGDVITVAPPAVLVATFDSPTGDGAIALANEERTLFNSFDYGSMDATGIRSLLASQIVWLVGPDTSCYADFDMDGSLTIFDFLAFQNAFDIGDLAADCDEDGTLTLFDFLCFQNAFDAGCP